MSKKGNTNHEGSWQSFPFILKTDFLHLKSGYKDESACLWKQLKWKKFSFYGDRLSGNFYHGINIADSVSEKITEEEQSPLIRRQVVLRIYYEQMTEPQKSFKTCTNSPKKETPSIYWNRCSFDQKRKSCPFKAGMNRLKSYKKQQLPTLQNHFLNIVANNSNSLLPATNVPNHWWSFSSKSAYDQNSVLNFVEIE